MSSGGYSTWETTRTRATPRATPRSSTSSFLDDELLVIKQGACSPRSRGAPKVVGVKKIIKIMPLAEGRGLKPCHGRSAARLASKQSKVKTSRITMEELLDDRLAEARGALDVLLFLPRDDGERCRRPRVTFLARAPTTRRFKSENTGASAARSPLSSANALLTAAGAAASFAKIALDVSQRGQHSITFQSLLLVPR